VPVLVALPLWGYVYHLTLEPPPAGESDPLVLGEEVYIGCAGCHGPTGGGGSGPALTGVLDTWPDYRDHMMWVRIGATGWKQASGTDTYGATNKASGGIMPAHPELSDQQLAQVVLYERTAFGELDPTSDEYLALTAIADGTSTFKAAGLGDLSTAAKVPDSDLEAGG
jgi:mono/diheme cytochrome c family protein